MYINVVNGKYNELMHTKLSMSHLNMFLFCVQYLRHIDYCMHRVNLLRHYGVKPMLVFDGGLLPMKIEQENKRARYSGYPLISI